MEFEDMQVIWDKQNQEKMFAINEAALHKKIKEKGKSITRHLSMFESVMLFIVIGTGLINLVDAINDREALNQYVGTAIIFMVAGLIFYFRNYRKEKATVFDDTILGDLEQSIAAQKHYMWMLKTFPLWYGLPFTLTILISIIFNGLTAWFLAFMIGTILLTMVGVNWEIKRYHEPKLADLEKMREKLLANE